MSKLKTRLEYNNKNNKYIESLKKVYLIGHWARYGVLEFPYAGKMVEDDLFGMTPLVYDLDDHNGTYAEYILTKINDVTTGDVIIYTFNRNLAQALSDKLNEYKSCQVTNYIQNSIETLQEENKRINTVLNLVKEENQELNENRQLREDLCQKDKQIADLETKLEESKKAIVKLTTTCDEWADKYLELETKSTESEKQCRECKHLNKKIELNIKNKLMAENCELQKQLAEKEKRCEICGSKMILGELGYYCNNDELHPIYQAPNEAKSDYEKITLLKQDYDAMVEREELLRQQLAEKEKEIEKLTEELDYKNYCNDFC